jgi:hypothetical protein
MPLQNRVTPFGNLVAVEGRGLLMGNRGRLHDAERRIVRYARGRRWIACLTSFRGRRRTIMSPGLYTELFFLDEAVALAAGHRPCAECRRDDYLRFRVAWARAVSDDISADGMDMKLDADRLAGPRTKRTYRDASSALPDGAFVDIGGAARLVWRGALHAWAAAGYAERREPLDGLVTVITPRAIVDVIRAGYQPGVHPSGPRRRPRPWHRPGPRQIAAPRALLQWAAERAHMSASPSRFAVSATAQMRPSAVGAIEPGHASPYTSGAGLRNEIGPGQDARASTSFRRRRRRR